MKLIELTHGKHAMVDDDDYPFLSRFRWLLTSNGYAKCMHVHDKILMHRLIMGANKNKLVDHINRNPLDNQKSNLRFATKSMNSFNRKINNNNTSGVIGVCKNKNKWEAFLKLNRVVVFRKYYANFEEAVAARKDAERIYILPLVSTNT